MRHHSLKFPRAAIGFAAFLLVSCLAAAEDARPPDPTSDDPTVRARVDGILSMVFPEGDIVTSLVPEFLAREGKAAVPYLVSLVDAGLAQEDAPETSRRQVPVTMLVDALGRLRDERALAVLVKSISKGTTEQRVAAAGALARYRSKESLDALIHALGQTVAEARSSVVQALVETSRGLSGVDVPRMVLEAAKKDRTLHTGAAEALAQLGGPVASAFFRSALSDPDASVRLNAVDLVARVSPEEAGGWVQPLLGDENLNVQKQACIALGQLKTTAAVPDLIALLDPDADPGLRANAVWALQQITGQALSDDPELWRTWWEGNQPQSQER